MVINRLAGGLNQKYVSTAAGFVQRYRNLAVSKGFHHAVAKRDAQLLADSLRKSRVGIAAENFDIPLDHLLGNPTFVKYYLDKFPEDKFDHNDFVVVSPDVGSVARARAFAAKVHMGLAIVDKRRQKANECEVMNVIGDVRGKTCILYDDMIDTAGSLCNAANALVEVGGAKQVFACATHGVLSGPAFERIEKSAIAEVVVHNTIPLTNCTCNKIKQLDVAPIFARAISHIHGGTSIADLF